MNIAVIGAGIIGITSAYELAVSGHQVTVFERRSAAAEEGSFANAGVIAPAYIAPWAAPGMPWKVASELFKQHAQLRLSLPLSLSEISWAWKWLRACKPETYALNRARMLRLAFYSRDRLHEISQQHSFEYDHSQGFSVLLRSEKDLRQIEPSLQLLRDAKVPFEQLSAAQMRIKEPALNPDTHRESGIYLPDDEVANCRQFALMLKNKAQEIGVKFEFSTSVSSISSGRPVKIFISGETAPRVFDQAVLCAGVESARLLLPLGLKIPLAAVYGYSVSASIREPLNAPFSALIDEQYKVTISRLGKRVRVAGSAELGGSIDKHRAASLQTLYKVLHDWFPGAAAHLSHQTSVQEWKGARPMLPDGPPIVGSSGLTGLWLNLGHGASGWTMGCGSARALADMIDSREPAIDMEGLGVSRLL